MRKASWKLFIAAVTIIIASTAWAGEQSAGWQASDYIIGPGDVLDISVWKDAALTKLAIVLPDGKISFPLIGQVEAGGKTVAQLRKVLEKKLTRFVPDLNLSILVSQVNSMMVYVIGRVNNPGRFLLNTNVNVLQVLSIAGGLNPFAKRSKIKILRATKGQTKIILFNYDSAIKGENLQQNIQLKRGDVVVVP